MPQVLEGMRVVDVTTGPVGGMATMVLADFGAEVVKVERPGGDRFRALPGSSLWLRGKRSVIADLTTETGRGRVRDLVATADVLVVSGPPSRARRWGLDADAAFATRPDLVHCSITGWGQSGPLAEVPGWEGAVAARSGRMKAFERQLRRGGPVYAALPVASHVAAHGAVQGIVAALYARLRGGGPQRVETSLLHGLLPFDLVELLLVEVAQRGGMEVPNILAAGGDLPTLNYHPVRTKDGRWIQCGNLLEHLLFAFFDATGLLGDLLADEHGRFLEPPGTWDAATIEVARDLMLVRMQERTAEEWMEVFRANGNVAAEVFLTTQEALRHPDVVGNGDVVTVEDPVRGPVRTIGPVAELTVTPAAIGRSVPAVGEDDTTLPAGTPWPADAVAPAPVSGGRPLEGVTVVEYATIIAAPLATSMLADLGATVVKVEMLDGDPYRHLVPGGAVAAKTTAGKSSIAADLKHEEGRRIARDLAATADVVVHNARPGVPERLGLGEEQLRSLRPELVYVSLTGYGRHAPGADRPSTHPCAGAATGGPAYQAGAALGAACDSLDDVREISRQLIRANEANPDPNTGVVVAEAVILALLARERFGTGQAVHVNMLTANLYANADDAVDYAGKPPRPVQDADLTGLRAGYRLYRAGGGWVFLALDGDDDWRRCWDVLGASSVAADARFADAAGRAQHDAELDGVLASLLAPLDPDDAERRFVAAGLAGVRADSSTPGTFFSGHEHALANDLAPECTHARFGTHRRWGPIVRVNGGGTCGPGVLAGGQTREILASLGRSGDEVDAAALGQGGRRRTGRVGVSRR